MPEECSFLILGSFPGRNSTSGNTPKDDWYYSAPRNQFWKIMGELWPGRNLSLLKEKMRLFGDIHMAVTDVILSCERAGESNLDSNLKQRIYNTETVESILSGNHLCAVFCTGKGVAKLFRKHFSNPDGVPVVPLPSPSPAMFSMTIDEKIKCWRELFLEYGVPLPI